VSARTPRLRIRDATAGDALLLADFNARLARESEGIVLGRARLRRGVAALLGDPSKGRYLVAEVDGEPAGALMITREYSDWRCGWFWWIQSAYVVEACRRLGVFRALFRRVQRMARRARDVCGLRLYVEGANERAQRTYESVGMRRTSYHLYEIDHVLREERARAR
jgi:GNAT superfamily N-acetyltransferase